VGIGGGSVGTVTPPVVTPPVVTPPVVTPPVVTPPVVTPPVVTPPVVTPPTETPITGSPSTGGEPGVDEPVAGAVTGNLTGGSIQTAGSVHTTAGTKGSATAAVPTAVGSANTLAATGLNSSFALWAGALLVMGLVLTALGRRKAAAIRS